jgi:predicted permease
LTGESNVNGIQLEGTDRQALDPVTHDAILVNVRSVSDAYFTTLDIPLQRGRGIEPGDRARGEHGGLGVTVVSARLAAKLWPGRDPIGKRFSTGSQVGKVEVVGVVADVHNARLDQDPTLVAYVPFWKQGPGAGDLVLRTALPPEAVMSSVRSRLWALDPGLPVPTLRTLAEIVAESLSQRRFQMQLAAGFALFALLLAALGVYGVVSYNVAQRRREIGVRMALGAQAADVLRLVLARGFRPVLAGLAVGIAVALLSGQLIRSLLFGVSATDPVTIAGVALVLAAMAGLACLLPALDAARVDPGSALHEG